MRIIDEKRDYYDTAAAYGVDPGIVFARTGTKRLTDTEVYGGLQLPRALCGVTVKGDTHDRPTISLHRRNEMPEVRRRNVRHVLQTTLVVIAGTLRRGIHAKAQQMYGSPHYVDARWIWSPAALRSYVADHDLAMDEGKDGIIQGWESEWVKIAPGRSNSKIDVRRLGIESWFAPEELTGRTIEALVENRITILSRNPTEFFQRDADGTMRRWHVDQATLAPMDFAKAVPPAIAFQEIAMWRGGVLGNDAANAPDIVDDLIKIAKHGYDKRSFRKDKAQS